MGMDRRGGALHSCERLENVVCDLVSDEIVCYLAKKNNNKNKR